MKFSKPAISITDQIALLRRRGMVVDDEASARHYLSHISYYRLRAYWLPFEAAAADGDHALTPGTRFEDVLALYVFDRQLRLMVMDAVERVEVAIRAQWAHHMAMTYGAHGYLDQAHYAHVTRHASAVADLTKEFRRSRDTFAEHYRKKYTAPKLPPVWMAAEVMSFGLLSKFLGDLKLRSDRQAIARPFGLDEKVLTSFAHQLSHARNICAHHGRLGLIWRGLSNQLAVAAAPALEAVADAMAAVARTTGPLGIAIRTLFDNLGRLTAYATGIATLMAGRFVAAKIAAAASVRGLAIALVILRGALLRLPLIGLIVAAGELIHWFGRLVRGAGGFGAALSLLGDLAREVWERMQLGAVAMGLAIIASWADIKAAIATALQASLEAVVSFGNSALNTFRGAFDAIKLLWGALPGAIGDFAFQAANALIAGVEAMLNGVGNRINRFLDGINAGLAALGIERRVALVGNLELGRIDNPFAGSAAKAGNEARAAFKAAFAAEPITMPDLGLGDYAEEARGQAEALRAVMSGVVDAATAPLESVAALREAVAASGAEAEAALTGARTAAESLEEALDATGEAAGRAGGAGRGAGQALREAADTARGAWEATADAVRAAQERSREIAQGLAQDIVGPIKEALKSGEFTWETFASAISRIAQNLANRLIELAFKPIENAIMRAFSGMGGGGGVFASLFGFARGGVFAGGQELTAFARGGVVNRPTVFPFSRGIGLMGEAGPEAILPLRRGRDGRLGVEMNSAPAQPAQDMSTRIINVLDPSVVGDYLATPAGERAILNVIRRNRSALNA